MRTIEINDWILLNKIIYDIYSVEKTYDFGYSFLNSMRAAVEFDSADFYFPAYELNNSFIISFNCDIDTKGIYEKYKSDNGIMYGARSMVYRDTDMVKDDRTNKKYFKEFYENQGWNYSIHMTLGKNRNFLGAVTFYRCKGKENFSYDDIFILDMIKDHLSLRLNNDRVHMVNLHDKLTVSEASEKYGLTKQEHMILKFLMDGQNNDFICGSLEISVNTLKKHILNIYRKLGIKNRVQMFKMIKEKE